MSDLLILKLFSEGGFMMFPLILCSILAVAAIIERGISLRANKILCIEDLIEIEDLIRSGNIEDAYNLTKEATSPMLRIVKVALLNTNKGEKDMQDAIESTGRLEIPELQKNLALLNTLAVISPLVGMLGTVLGMIQVFDAVMGDGGINMTVLADGISQALITSAFGLSIAVPCLISYNMYFRKIEKLTTEMEKYSLTLMNLLRRFIKKEGIANNV